MDNTEDFYSFNVGSIPASRTNQFGVWRSPVAHLVWDQGVQGSNPCTPTNSVVKIQQTKRLTMNPYCTIIWLL